MTRETDDDCLIDWTPRMSQAFKISMQKHLAASGKRRWNDRTMNRILDQIRTFSKWIHKHHPFPLGNPMYKIKSLATSSLLDVDRALTPTERRRLLDAAGGIFCYRSEDVLKTAHDIPTTIAPDIKAIVHIAIGRLSIPLLKQVCAVPQ